MELETLLRTLRTCLQPRATWPSAQHDDIAELLLSRKATAAMKQWRLRDQFFIALAMLRPQSTGVRARKAAWLRRQFARVGDLRSRLVVLNNIFGRGQVSVVGAPAPQGSQVSSCSNGERRPAQSVAVAFRSFQSVLAAGLSMSPVELERAVACVLEDPCAALRLLLQHAVGHAHHAAKVGRFVADDLRNLCLLRIAGSAAPAAAAPPLCTHTARTAPSLPLLTEAFAEAVTAAAVRACARSSNGTTANADPRSLAALQAAAKSQGVRECLAGACRLVSRLTHTPVPTDEAVLGAANCALQSSDGLTGAARSGDALRSPPPPAAGSGPEGGRRQSRREEEARVVAGAGQGVFAIDEYVRCVALPGLLATVTTPGGGAAPAHRGEDEANAHSNNGLHAAVRTVQAVAFLSYLFDTPALLGAWWAKDTRGGSNGTTGGTGDDNNATQQQAKARAAEKQEMEEDEAEVLATVGVLAAVMRLAGSYWRRLWGQTTAAAAAVGAAAAQPQHASASEPRATVGLLTWDGFHLKLQRLAHAVVAHAVSRVQRWTRQQRSAGGATPAAAAAAAVRVALALEEALGAASGEVAYKAAPSVCSPSSPPSSPASAAILLLWAEQEVGFWAGPLRLALAHLTRGAGVAGTLPWPPADARLHAALAGQAPPRARAAEEGPHVTAAAAAASLHFASSSALTCTAVTLPSARSPPAFLAECWRLVAASYPEPLLSTPVQRLVAASAAVAAVCSPGELVRLHGPVLGGVVRAAHDSGVGLLPGPVTEACPCRGGGGNNDGGDAPGRAAAIADGKGDACVAGEAASVALTVMHVVFRAVGSLVFVLPGLAGAGAGAGPGGAAPTAAASGRLLLQRTRAFLALVHRMCGDAAAGTAVAPPDRGGGGGGGGSSSGSGAAAAESTGVLVLSHAFALALQLAKCATRVCARAPAAAAALVEQVAVFAMSMLQRLQQLQSWRAATHCGSIIVVTATAAAAVGGHGTSGSGGGGGSNGDDLGGSRQPKLRTLCPQCLARLLQQVAAAVRTAMPPSRRLAVRPGSLPAAQCFDAMGRVFAAL